MAPLRVRVVPDAPPLLRFVLRLCAIVGGVYTSAGKQTHAYPLPLGMSLMAGEDDEVDLKERRGASSLGLLDGQPSNWSRPG